MTPKIIGISGNMGAGKTTLAKALALNLRATMISWDNFDEISIGPDDYVDWYRRGQNYHEWNYAALAEVLESLKAQKSIAHPTLSYTQRISRIRVGDRVASPMSVVNYATEDEARRSTQPKLERQRVYLLKPTKYIVFDAPLGLLHMQTGQYIDICIHIEIPLDVSLSRWLIRDFKANDKTKDELIEELEFYLAHSRPLFFDDKLKESAHFIVDGMLSTEAQIHEIKRYLREYENQPPVE